MQPSPPNETDRSEHLRKFMAELKNWPAESPPSRLEYNTLKTQYRLTREDERRLIDLADKHVQRGHAALNDNLTIQAAEEFSRAAQLIPHDIQPKIELASVLIKGITSEFFSKTSKEKIFQLLKIILELQPKNQRARVMQAQVRRLFRRETGSRHFMFFILVFLLFLAALITGRIWYINYINRSSSPAIIENLQSDTSETQSIIVDTSHLDASDNFTMHIISATAGNQNDSSWLNLIGRIRADNLGLNNLTLGIQGRSNNGNRLFLTSWPVLDNNSPVLQPGDTLPVQTLRWLTDPSEQLQSVSLNILEEGSPDNETPVSNVPAILVWDTVNPLGVSFLAEFRNPRWIEAFDRQIFMTDIALTNTGTATLGDLSLKIAFEEHVDNISLENIQLIKPGSAPMLMGERRVAALNISIPLEAESRQPLVHVVDVQQAK